MTGAVFVAILLGSILFNQYTFLIVFALIQSLALWEFYGLINSAKQTNIPEKLNALGGLLLFLAAFAYYSGLYTSSVVFIPYLIYIQFLFVFTLYNKRSSAVRSLAYSLMGQAYIALPFSLANYLVFTNNAGGYHSIFLLALLVMLWVNDSFAYLTGSQFGKHRLFERISPKKSWEGSVGGAAFTLLTALIFSHFYNEFHVAGWLGFGLIVIVFGTWGDLIESLLKRTVGVKDSGNILPGHGGILDRFDSLIFSIPALFVYLKIVQFIATL
nr:phosphatidate cytidylyltransferase [Dysgonomonas sp. 520]